MTNKKISIIKAFALAILSVALVFCAVGSMLNATAAESRISSITIEIDYGDYDANDLPKGKAGKSYPVFAFVATGNRNARYRKRPERRNTFATRRKIYDRRSGRIHDRIRRGKRNSTRDEKDNTDRRGIYRYHGL